MIHMEMPASQWKAIVNMMSPLVSEVKVKANADGLSIRAVDHAHVAMVGLDIASSAIQNYKVDEEEEAFGLDISKTISILKLAGGDENVILDVGDRMEFRIGNIKRSMLPLDTASMTEPKIPELNPSAHAIAKSEDLQRSIKAINGIGSDVASFSISPGVLRISSQAETQDALMELKEGEGCTIETEGDFTSNFPMDYISQTVPAIPSNYEVSVGIDNDYPMLLSFSDNGIKGTYMVAPRIENE